MTTIQDFYKHVLSALRYRVDDEGLISFMAPDGTVIPASVDKRRLVLPTDAWLRKGFTEDLQPFHPLSESIARRAASPVLVHMQRTARAVLAHNFLELATRLLAVAAEPSLHKDLPPACGEYLKKVPHADKKTLAAFEQLTEKAMAKNQLITLYLKNGGKYDGKKVNRLCVIRFPLMDLLEGDDDAPLGVKLRKKDKQTLHALLHHIMPFGDSPEEYSAGSDSRIAPFFDAFLRAYTKAATQQNKIINRYTKAMDMSLSPLPLDYLEELENLGQFYEKIPALRGNQGGINEEDETTPAPQPQAAPAARQQAATAPARPAVETRPATRQEAEASGKATVSIKDFLNSTRPPQPPAYPQQPQQPYGAYQQPAGYGPYGKPQQPNRYAAYPVTDPRRPAWLGGQPQQPQQPANPFAQAFATTQAPQQPMGYQMPYGQPPAPAQNLPWNNGQDSGRL